MDLSALFLTAQTENTIAKNNSADDLMMLEKTGGANRQRAQGAQLSRTCRGIEEPRPYWSANMIYMTHHIIRLKLHRVRPVCDSLIVRTMACHSASANRLGHEAAKTPSFRTAESMSLADNLRY